MFTAGGIIALLATGAIVACGEEPDHERPSALGSQSCWACHADRYLAAERPDHLARAMPRACEDCHTTVAWRPAEAGDHDRYWPLTGRHLEATCASCHTEGLTVAVATECVGCHEPDFLATVDPNHVAGQYPTSCGGCHDTAGWRPARFEHDAFWPLEGRHEATTCGACHEGAAYADAPRACEGCHLADYQGAVAPAHVAAQIPTACADCHTAAGWSPAAFDIHDRYWALAGRHIETACVSCHDGGAFAGTPRECVGCHEPDFVATTDPDHELGFPRACQGCHDASAWRPSGFDHAASWPLDGGHTTATCASCHADDVFVGTTRECVGCHRPDYDAAARPSHIEAEIATTCADCHSAAGWSPAAFDVHDRYWALAGRHVETACVSCHDGGAFAGTPRECVGCHEPDYDAAARPSHLEAEITTACADCHTTLAWQPAAFDIHDRYWALAGRHVETACVSCHDGGAFAGTPRECVGCHEPDFVATTDPDHELGFPRACQGCHDASAWRPSGFDHAASWPLDGGHTTATCASCHADDVFVGTARECVGCHRPDYDAAARPSHVEAALETTCADCHMTLAWRPADFEVHDRYWTLTGAHVDLDCVRCHEGDVFGGTARECVGCHREDYDATTAPDHARWIYPESCQRCHDTNAWTSARFDHAASWPLEGRHASATCTACHAGEVYAGTARYCEGCHQPDYDATTRPSHVDAQLPTACAGCHTASGWAPADFTAHDRYWPLGGRHLVAACASCHVDGVFEGTPRECVGCHRAAYDAAADPDHAAAGYPQTCQGCHGTDLWRPASFDHTSFWPLAGLHATTACTSCHVEGVYAGTPRLCEGCHLPEYQATTDPSHAAAQLPTACAGCHTALGWRPVDFAAHDQHWPLEGRHATTTCVGCHVGGVYAGTPTACDACHHSDFVATAAPAHVAAGFPTTCQTCHDASAWVPSSFDHEATWPIRGAHIGAACASCHGGGVYVGTPRVCQGCHLSDYQAATNPSHVALGLPSTCVGCHNEASWATTIFPGHAALFPITSGPHKVFGCTACHKSPATDWGSFTCTGCHTGEHQLARMSQKHAEVNGYTPALTTYGVEGACLHCHPTGQDD